MQPNNNIAVTDADRRCLENENLASQHAFDTNPDAPELGSITGRLAVIAAHREQAERAEYYKAQDKIDTLSFRLDEMIASRDELLAERDAAVARVEAWKRVAEQFSKTRFQSRDSGQYQQAVRAYDALAANEQPKTNNQSS